TTSTATRGTTGGRTYARCANAATTPARPGTSHSAGGSTRMVADEGRRLRASDARRCRAGPRALAHDARGWMDRAGIDRLRRRLPPERPRWWRDYTPRDGETVVRAGGGGGQKLAGGAA